MVWPFSRRRPRRPQPQPPVSQELDMEDARVIPLEDTIYEDIVVAILERAQQEASSRESGDRITVFMTDDEWDRCEFPMYLIGPVFDRAGDYGLMPEVVFNQEFTFTVI